MLSLLCSPCEATFCSTLYVYFAQGAMSVRIEISRPHRFSQIKTVSENEAAGFREETVGIISHCNLKFY